MQEKNKIDAINETEDKSIGNESNKGMSLVKSRSLDKSRASQRTETENTVNPLKKRYISSASLYNKNINVEQPREINVRSDSPSISSMSRPGASIKTVLQDK